MGLPYCTNRGLFSDHYLATRLPELPEWDRDYGSLRSGLSALLTEKADARVEGYRAMLDSLAAEHFGVGQDGVLSLLFFARGSSKRRTEVPSTH